MVLVVRRRNRVKDTSDVLVKLKLNATKSMETEKNVLVSSWLREESDVVSEYWDLGTTRNLLLDEKNALIT